MNHLKPFDDPFIAISIGAAGEFLRVRAGLLSVMDKIETISPPSGS